MSFFFLYMFAYFSGVVVGIYAYTRALRKEFDRETERVRREYLARLRGDK